MTLSSGLAELTSGCPTCGGSVLQTGRGRPRRFCSQKCLKRHNSRRANRSRLPLRNPTTKSCAHCGKTFEAKNRNRIYCYDGWCAQSAYASRRRSGREVLIRERVTCCDNCNQEFVARHPSARWCSKTCANRYWGRIRSRLRRPVVHAEYVDREIFERDGWRCHLCNKPVDRNAKRNSDFGATIDHLIPLSLGGTDVAANVATAHFLCNIKKGISPVDEQLRLLG